MKRYILFAGYEYYPKQGAEDMRGQFDDIQSANSVYQALVKEDMVDWGHLLDTDDYSIIRMFDVKP